MTPSVVVVPEVAEHGVTVFAAALAAAVGRPGLPLDAVATGDPAHVQFTDRLWGTTPDAAAAAFEQAAARHPLTVTLHDLPQPSDGAESMRRRVAAYGRVVAAARGVVVSSAHEQRLLAEHVGEQATVIPLPVGAPASGRQDVGRDVAVLGFFYPGKGHDEALAAAVAAGASGVTVLGRASTGHEGDLAAFAARATDAGMPVEVTGYLSREQLVDRARRAGVPVVGHRHISASGSLGTWLEAGRRPVVLRHPYTEEYATLRPGAIVLADDLGAAVAAALADPASTWHAPGTVLPWDAADAADAYLSWWESLS